MVKYVYICSVCGKEGDFDTASKCEVNCFEKRMKNGNEPSIIVNGEKLNIGQVMTIRTALTSFIIELQQNGLGEDEHGKIMTNNYLVRANEIQNMFYINRG